MLALSPAFRTLFSPFVAVVLALIIAIASVNPAAAWGGPSVVGSGKAVEDVRLVSGYTKVEIKGAVDVEVRQSGREGVVIIADDNIAPLIRASVSGKTLVIDSNASWSTRLKMRVVIDVIALEGLAVSGAGDARLAALKADALELSISGSGDIVVEGLQSNALNVRISGSGDFRGSGVAKVQSYSIAGSGDIRAEGIEGTQVKVRIAGSGDARVWPKESLDAVIMGSGDIRYKGKPSSVKKSVLGSGAVSEL
jgi:hypothetical protein